MVRIDGDRQTSVHGACYQGEGNETVFAQICADALSVRIDDVTVIGGDTAGLTYGLRHHAWFEFLLLDRCIAALACGLVVWRADFGRG